MISPTTTRRLQPSRFGFTLVEMMITVTVLALVSVAVVPSLINMQASSDRRQTISGVRNVASDARERAVQNGKETQVIYDESTKELQIQSVEDDGTATTISAVHLTAGIVPQKFQLQGKDSGQDDFKLTFTPDGHSIGGGIEFADFSILVDTNGVSQYITGPLPDPTEQQWQAGNLEQRN